MIIRSVVVSIFFLQMFCKKPRTGSTLSEALRTYEIPGPGSSLGERATGPTECITRASTIGSIQRPSSRYPIVNMSLWMVLELGLMATGPSQFSPLRVIRGHR
jgi:hypothetical protein